MLQRFRLSSATDYSPRIFNTVVFFLDKLITYFCITYSLFELTFATICMHEYMACSKAQWGNITDLSESPEKYIIENAEQSITRIKYLVSKDKSTYFAFDTV